MKNIANIVVTIIIVAVILFLGFAFINNAFEERVYSDLAKELGFSTITETKVYSDTFIDLGEPVQVITIGDTVYTLWR